MIVTTPLKQNPGSQDCVAYVAAMATGTSVADFKNFCKDARFFGIHSFPKYEAPYGDIHIYAYLLHCGYLCGYGFRSNDKPFKFVKAPLDELIFDASFPLIDTPAYVVVQCDASPDGEHAIYWDGKQIYDPAPGVRNGRHPSCYAIKYWVPIYKADEA